MIRGTDVFAVRLTALTQRGSIPATQAVILSTLVLLPMAMLVLGARDRPELKLWDSPLQVGRRADHPGRGAQRDACCATGSPPCCSSASPATAAASIFVFHGAPDLALTQFLVETLTLVIFVLVLRTLPAEADQANINRHRLPRAALALAVGATRHHARGVRDGRPHHPADRRPAARRRLLPRPRRQHRQRAARRHPRLGHHGRDLGAAGRGDRRGVNGVPQQAVRRRAAGRRRRPARHRPHPRARRPAPPSATSPGCAAANCATRGTGRWCSRWRRESSSRSSWCCRSYFFFAGHNTPGGGFAGGLTAGLALVLRYLAGGRYELGEALPAGRGQDARAPAWPCRRAPR